MPFLFHSFSLTFFFGLLRFGVLSFCGFDLLLCEVKTIGILNFRYFLKFSEMERDFMGLNSKDSVVVVKEEPVETCKDSGSFFFSIVNYSHIISSL